MTVNVVYSLEHPSKGVPSIFLAGPTPRCGGQPGELGLSKLSWRPQAIRILKRLNFHGNVIVPETPDLIEEEHDWDAQVYWEWDCLDDAAVIVFWIPRNMHTMPGLTTNVEFGLYVDGGNVIAGAPHDAENVGYLKKLSARHGVPWFDELPLLLRTAVDRL